MKFSLNEFNLVMTGSEATRLQAHYLEPVHLVRPQLPLISERSWSQPFTPSRPGVQIQTQVVRAADTIMGLS